MMALLFIVILGIIWLIFRIWALEECINNMRWEIAERLKWLEGGYE